MFIYTPSEGLFEDAGLFNYSGPPDPNRLNSGSSRWRTTVISASSAFISSLVPEPAVGLDRKEKHSPSLPGL